MFEHYPADLDYKTFIYLKASLIKENPKKKTKIITPLNLVPCESITFQGKNIKYAQECLVFDKQS